MVAAIHHRGPDNSGVWCEDSVPLVFGHARLSILDVSTSGHQPMQSACGRYTLVFNGEVYNHHDLRNELVGQNIFVSWRGRSDTETLLACFSAWGVENTLRKMIGMFAFALWDRQEQCLTMARDRLGEKPLYWGWVGNALIFASELKAIKTYPGYKADIDRNSIALLLRYGYIPAPHSIYAGIEKLLPACFIRIPLTGDIALSKAAQPERYWSVATVVAHGLNHPFQGNESDAVDRLEDCLMRSVGGQMAADVPVGAFLSGGIDSSLVVALMQAQSAAPVRTFTIGFDEAGYNEAEHAAAVARHLRTVHTELYVKGSDALAVIPALPSIYCEPFSDSSQIPTFLLARMTAEHVKVSLSGDGGDELFGGYKRYLFFSRIWSVLQRYPLSVRRILSAFLLVSPSWFWKEGYKLARPFLPRSFHVSMPEDKIKKISKVLILSDSEDFYRNLVSICKHPEKLLVGNFKGNRKRLEEGYWTKNTAFEHTMMAADMQMYMPDDILVKVDRAAMANSLETRIPMLDHKVVELAWQMPLHYKIRNGQGKWLLRQLLYRYVPKELIERPKMGFGIPLAIWLRGPLREWAEDLLSATRLRQEGYFKPEPICAMWQEHVDGKKNWHHELWCVLMFQAWLAAQNAMPVAGTS